MRNRTFRSTVALGLAALLLPLFLAAGAAAAEPTALKQFADGIRITLLFDGGAETGGNVVKVRLEDLNGRALRGAEVALAMEPVEEEAAPQSAKPAPEPKAKKPASKKSGMGDMNGGMASSSGDEEESAREQEVEPIESDGEPTEARETEDAESEPDHAAPETIQLLETDDPGTYRAELELEEAGEWHAAVHFDVDGIEREVEFVVDVAEKEPNWLVLGGFLGVNVAVVLGAAITRRKSLSA